MFSPRRLKSLAAQLGYEYRVDLSLDDLGGFANAPWRIKTEGARDAEVREALHRLSEHGLFMLGDFSIDPGGDSRYLIQTVAGVRLNAQPPGLKRFISRLRLPKGLHCVMRGDCVYVFVGLYAARSPRMSTAEAAACLDALALMARGDYAGAFRELSSIESSRAWPDGLPFVFVAAIWGSWVYVMVTNPDVPLGILFIGTIFLVLHLVFWWMFANRASVTKSYADLRID